MTRADPRTLLVGQFAALAIGVALALLWPPPAGPLLLVPLAGPRPVARLALDGGARLLRRGPVPGSLVVWADRARLLGPLGRAGVVVLAAPAALCGKGRP